MAVINLKVLVDGSAIDAEISKINSSFNKGIKGTAVDNLQKKYANLISTVKNYEKSFPKGTFDKQNASLSRHLNRVKELSQSYERSGKLTKDQQKQYLQLSKDYANISAKVATLRAETEKLEKSNKLAIPSVDNLRKKYANLLNTIQGSEKNYKKGTFSKIAEEAQANLNIIKKLDPASADYAKTVNRLDKDLSRLSADFAETKTSATNFHGSLQDIVSGFIKFQLAATLVMKPLQMLKNAYDDLNETLVETEKRVVALQRVAGSAANADDLYKLAQKYGQTFENVADVTERFAKSGYDWSESIKAAEAALTAMNVAEMDSEQATEGLIAVMKQYGFEIEKLDYIIGVLNKTGDTAAVTTEELLIALQKTGSTAKNANVSFEETVGLITALSEGTAASGQNIGNALRSLFVFTSDDKALETFAGLSDGMAKTVKEYRMGKASILDIWKGLGGELEGMGSQRGTLEDLFGGAALTEDIEAQLTQITDSFAEIYGTAGNYRQNYFIALLDNIDKVQKVTENLGDVTGYSQQENLKYLNTYEGKLATLTAQWQQMANDEQGIVKVKKLLVDLASLALTGLEKIGGFRTVIIAFGFTIMSVLIPALEAAKIKFKQLGVSVNAAMGIVGAIFTAISAVVGIIDSLNDGLKKVNQNNIDLWNSNKEYAAELYTLSKQYESLDLEAASYSKTEERILELLGEKTVVLDGLTRGTEEYKDALEKLQLQELETLLSTKETAKNSAYSNLHIDSTSFTDRIFDTYYRGYQGLFSNFGALFEGDNPIRLISEMANKYVDGNFTHYVISPKSAEDVLKGYDQATKLIPFVSKRMNEIGTYKSQNPNDDQYDRELATLEGIYNISEDFIKTYGENVKAYLDASKSIEEIAEEILKKTKEEHDALNKIRDDLSDLSKEELENILKKVNEIRNATKDAYEYEEKKKAVLEAEKALLDAQHNRTVRVLNEATGQWEWVSNAKEVEDAKDNLAKARAAVEDAFFDEVEDALKTGNVTSAGILAIIAKWAGAYGSGDFSALEGAITDVIKEMYGIDLRAYYPENYQYVGNIEHTQPTLKENNDGSYVIEQEDGTKLVDNGDGNTYVEYSNGTREYVYDDGSHVFVDKSGQKTYESYANGDQISYRGDGSIESQTVAGVTTTFDILGNKKITKRNGSSIMFDSEGNLIGVKSENQIGFDASKGAAHTKKWSTYQDVIDADMWEYVYTPYEFMSKYVPNDSTITQKEKDDMYLWYLNQAYEALNDKGLVYDSGGVLKGLGGIKATAEDEVVLDPSITKQLLTPVSNQQFDTFVKDLGLLFGMSKSTTNHGAVFGAGLYGHDSHDNHYSVNGVPIPVESAQKYTIAELFENMNLIPNI